MRKILFLKFSILLFCHLHAQNVGIGTGSETPTEQLQLGNFSNFTSTYLLINTTGGNQYRAGIKLRHYSDEHGFTLVSDETQSNFKILRHIYNSPGELAFLIDGFNGNVAIGYPAATNKLSVNGTADFTRVAIGTGTASTSAALDVNSTTHGFLPPRMTTDQRAAIVSPDEGLVIYNTVTRDLEFFDGLFWRSTKAAIIPTGAVSTNYDHGFLPAILPDAPSYQFLGRTITINVLEGQQIMVTSTASLGTTVGAVLERINIGFSVSGGAVSGSNDFILNTRMSANERMPITLSATYKNLTPGTYTFGMIYLTAPGQASAWNNNDWSRTLVTVFN